MYSIEKKGKQTNTSKKEQGKTAQEEAAGFRKISQWAQYHVKLKHFSNYSHINGDIHKIHNMLY